MKENELPITKLGINNLASSLNNGLGTNLTASNISATAELAKHNEKESHQRPGAKLHQLTKNNLKKWKNQPNSPEPRARQCIVEKTRQKAASLSSKSHVTTNSIINVDPVITSRSNPDCELGGIFDQQALGDPTSKTKKGVDPGQTFRNKGCQAALSNHLPPIPHPKGGDTMKVKFSSSKATGDTTQQEWRRPTNKFINGDTPTFITNKDHKSPTKSRLMTETSHLIISTIKYSDVPANAKSERLWIDESPEGDNEVMMTPKKRPSIKSTEDSTVNETAIDSQQLDGPKKENKNIHKDHLIGLLVTTRFSKKRVQDAHTNNGSKRTLFRRLQNNTRGRTPMTKEKGKKSTSAKFWTRDCVFHLATPPQLPPGNRANGRNTQVMDVYFTPETQPRPPEGSLFC